MISRGWGEWGRLGDWDRHIYHSFFLRVKQSGAFASSTLIPGDSENKIAVTWANMSHLCTRWHRLVDFKTLHPLQKLSSVITCGGGWPVRAVCPRAKKSQLFSTFSKGPTGLAPSSLLICNSTISNTQVNNLESNFCLVPAHQGNVVCLGFHERL